MFEQSGFVLSRRAFLKGAALVLATVPTAFVSGCADAGEKFPAAVSAASSRADRAASAVSSVADDVAALGAGKTLVAYFSATGHTKGVAEVIARELGADVFVVTPAEPYADGDLSYNEPASRVCAEHDDASRHVELAQATPDGFAGYDTVFVGAPTWWGSPSWVMDDFLAGNDFANKRLYYFTTSASSPLGSDVLDSLTAAAPNSTWLDGARFSSSFAEADVISWLDGLGL